MIQRRLILHLFLLSIALAGCTGLAGGDFPRPGTREGAESLAANWLGAVSGGADDRGWSMLHPLTRSRLFSDNAQKYLNEVMAIDWSAFKFHVERPAVLDGNYRVTVVLEADTRPADILADGRLIQVFPSDDGVSRASITILGDWTGVAGVLGG